VEEEGIETQARVRLEVQARETAVGAARDRIGRQGGSHDNSYLEWKAIHTNPHRKDKECT